MKIDLKLVNSSKTLYITRTIFGDIVFILIIDSITSKKQKTNGMCGFTHKIRRDYNTTRGLHTLDRQGEPMSCQVAE